jgi:hypothetical protein
MNVNKERLLILNEHWSKLTESMLTLHKSIDKARPLLRKDSFSFEEQETIDSLTSKFNRSSDLYSQKILRGIWDLLREPFAPFIDTMNEAEKFGIIESAESLFKIRELRNTIAHEYLPEELQQIIPEVIALSGQLQENINKTLGFLKQRGWL